MGGEGFAFEFWQAAFFCIPCEILNLFNIVMKKRDHDSLCILPSVWLLSLLAYLDWLLTWNKSGKRLSGVPAICVGEPQNIAEPEL